MTFREILRQRRFVPGCCLASSQVVWLPVDSGPVDQSWDRRDGPETEVDDASSPVRRVFFQENELQPVLVVDVLPDLAKPGLGHEGEGRRVIRRDRDHEPPYAVCHRPIHGACQRFESVALPSVGGKDDVAKLDGMMCIRIQIVRVRPGMKSEVTNHLSGVFQENGPGGPGEIVLILCQPRCRELQNCGVAYQVRRDTSRQLPFDGAPVTQQATANGLWVEATKKEPCSLNVRRQIAPIYWIWPVHRRSLFYDMAGNFRVGAGAPSRGGGCRNVGLGSFTSTFLCPLSRPPYAIPGNVPAQRLRRLEF